MQKKFGEGPISLKSIAQAHDLSEHYLEQLISPLRNARLVKSTRGAYGGYVLSDQPANITAGDVIRVLEGPISVVEMIEEEEPAQRQLWMRVRDAVQEVLDSTTLEDLVRYEEEKSRGLYVLHLIPCETIWKEGDLMERIYLDHAATSPTHPEVVEKMIPYMTETFGNPSSIHFYGRQTRHAVDEARRACARSIHANPNEIIFTSGGTEADNLALIGVARANRHKGNHIITTQIEHHAILHTCELLEREGFEVTYLPVDETGRVQVSDIQKALTEETILVSIMFGNNEVGTMQPIAEIGKLLKEHQAYFHTDAVQAYGLVEIDVKEFGIDLLSISAHKINGPKGVGFLYASADVKFEPLLIGGEQEENAVLVLKMCRASLGCNMQFC